MFNLTPLPKVNPDKAHSNCHVVAEPTSVHTKSVWVGNKLLTPKNFGSRQEGVSNTLTSSILISPKPPLPFTATKRNWSVSETTPLNITCCFNHGAVSDVCCSPLIESIFVQLVPSNISTYKSPVLEPYMW